MNVTQAHALACEKGRGPEFFQEYYYALRAKLSNQDAIWRALEQIRKLPSKKDMSAARQAYAQAFQEALDKGMSETDARLSALQSVPRRR